MDARVSYVPGKAVTTRRHEAHFYADEPSLLDNFTDFIVTALGTERAAIVVATESHREGLFPRLRAHGLDIAAATKQGIYISVDAAEMLSTFIINGRLHPDGFLKLSRDLVISAAQTAQRKMAAACGECAPLLWAQGKPQDAVRVEQLWNEIARTCDVDILCGYQVGNFPAEDSGIFQRICAEHSGVYYR